MTDTPTISSPIPSQDGVEEGEQYLIPTSMIRRSHGSDGRRFKAVKVEVVEKHIAVDESSHKIAEGIPSYV